MSDDKMDLYLQQGMYGPLETKPDERHLFLGSLRERVLLALTKGQVLRSKPYEEAERALKNSKNITLLINGELQYQSYSPYIQMANRNGVNFKIVSDLQFHTPLGLVIAADTAVNRELIYIQDDIFNRSVLKP
ncbi:YueI family protein [Bacillus cabrialesii]